MKESRTSLKDSPHCGLNIAPVSVPFGDTQSPLLPSRTGNNTLHASFIALYTVLKDSTSSFCHGGKGREHCRKAACRVQEAAGLQEAEDRNNGRHWDHVSMVWKHIKCIGMDVVGSQRGHVTAHKSTVCDNLVSHKVPGREYFIIFIIKDLKKNIGCV